VGLRLKANQSHTGVGHHMIDEGVAASTVGPVMGTVIQFDRQDEAGCCRVAQDEVNVLLRNGAAPAPAPVGLGAGDDVRQPHLAHDQESACHGLLQRAKKGGLSAGKQIGARVVATACFTKSAVSPSPWTSPSGRP